MPDSSMASKVNRRTVPGEDFFSFFKRYHRKRLTHALGLHRWLLPTGVSTRLHQTVLRVLNRPARRLGPPAAALFCCRPRNSRVPDAGQAKRGDHASESGLSSENGSASGQPRGVGPSFRLYQYECRDRVGGQSNFRGREQRRSASFGIQRGPTWEVRAVRSSLAASVRSLSSPARPA